MDSTPATKLHGITRRRPVSRTSIKTGHVLVVDDEPGIRDFLLATLRAEGFGAATAADGLQALERIAEQRPNVVLLDLAMPVMNGWQFQARLRELGLDIPLIFMSAGYNAREQAERHHAAGYLSKPFEVEEMLAQVLRFVRSPED
jgi:CheY-like chemotaxis protein